MADNDINLAALWVPVLAETSQIKGQLAKAGTEGAAAFTAAFKSAADLSGAFGGGRSLDLLTTRFKKLADVITGASSGASSAMQAFNTVGVASVAGLGAAMIGTTKAAGDFQASQMRLVASAGETAKGMQTVSNGLLQMAGQVGYSAQKLSDAMLLVEKAGYRGADGLKVMKAAAQGAKNENAELKPTIEGLTNTLTSFGLGADRATDVMSAQVVASGQAKTSFQDFGAALTNFEPQAQAAAASLDALGKQNLMANSYAVLAQLTQSGLGAARAAQNMGRAFSTLATPTAKMRDEMGQFGLNAEDVSQHLGERGLSGTMQVLVNAIRSKMDPAGHVLIDTFLKSEQATASAKTMFDAMPPAVQRVAQSIQNGTLSFAEFRKTRGGLSVEQANDMGQWLEQEKRITGYSSALKSGQGNIQTFLQTLALMTGNQETARIATLLTDDAAKGLNGHINELSQTLNAHNKDVKGTAETQSTLNAKMDDAKAAWGAAAIEIGTAFIPVMTQVANVAKGVGDEMARHPGITHAVVDALEALSAAWLGIKAIGIAETILAPVTAGLAAMASGEGVAAAGASALGGALGALGPIGAGAALGAATAGPVEHAMDDNSVLNNARNTVRGWFGAKPIPQGTHASSVWDTSEHFSGGGGVWGRGPKGKDSVATWLAPGEHVLTAGEVDRMGGQSAVYAFRKALHRVDGGEVGPDVKAAMGMAGTPYSQGSRRDCSGMVGRIVEAATGMGGPLPSTQNMGEWLAARGFVQGTGPAGTISVGWYNHGSAPNDGHAAMTLSDGQNAESGGSHGNFLVGGGVGASSSQFDHHMYLPNLYGEGRGGSAGVSGGSASGGSGGSGSSSGGSGGSGGSSTQSLAQQFGQGMLSGALSDLGFGNVLGGKSPLDWGIVKLATGLASWGLNMANSWADAKGKKLGLPGFGSGGGSGSPGGMLASFPGLDSLGAGLGDLSALGAGLSMGDSSTLGAGPLGGNGQGGSPAPGGGGLGAAVTGLIPGAGKSPRSWFGAGTPAAAGLKPLVPDWARQAPGAGQMPVIPGARAATPAPPTTGGLIMPGFTPSADTPWIPGMTAPVPLGPSTVGGVPRPAGADARAAGGGGNNIDNRIIVQGNQVTDPDGLAKRMQDEQSARIYNRGGMNTDGRGGSMPQHVGGGAG